jgi:RNA polymerase sigma-70 factor, ECF subfamily
MRVRVSTEAQPLMPPAARALADHDAPPDRDERDAELAALLRAAGRGNAEAFETFYDRTVGYASAFARRLVKPDDLDDVLSDAYFQAWREAARFDAVRGSAVTWLLMLVRSRALDLLRQRRHSASEVADSELAERASDLPGPDDVLALARDGSRLHAALATLSTNERWVLGLAYFRELTHQQIADCTGLPLGSVKSLIQRSQVRLRGLLGTQ